ncbi:MAG: phenylalanine--tRNA ligase subunit beta, partial [Chloroflexi bacterium]|nr:phenylalanine--tRNA ligase subunit beta [Chloroflexota bacterium]
MGPRCMKVPLSWLRDYVDIEIPAEELAHRLTMAGVEVAEVVRIGGWNECVVGQVITVGPHPQADRLSLCRVNTGGKEVEVVCGAPNVAEGQKICFASVGANLFNTHSGKHEPLKPATIRGVVSQGMICSELELGLGDDHTGIIVLPDEAPIGEPLDSYLGDTILDLELTPNRLDCLSMLGVAHEVAALAGGTVREPEISYPEAGPHITERVSISVADPDLCYRYTASIISGVSIGPSPHWLQERLTRAGMRPINNVVDVTNYVMLELGQPMHVFDLDKLVGGIRVRHAKKNESLTLLDGTRPRIQAGTLLIADHNGPVALAGIMGGLDSAVTDKTHNLLIESAYFRPQTIAGRARSLGMQTESSFRFERGVDPYLQRQAMQRATSLLLDIVGGRPGPILEESLTRHVPKRASVTLRRRRLTQLLGQELPVSKTQGILTRLGMRVRKRGDGWRVTPPSHRFDIEREEDLVEEVARVYGFESLPSQMPRISMGSRFASENHIPAERFKAVLADRDYQEVITYSFVDPALQRLLEPATEPMTLRNPI